MGCGSCLSEPCRCGTSAGLGGVVSGLGGAAVWSSWTVTTVPYSAPAPLTLAQQAEQARLQQETTERARREYEEAIRCQEEATARAEALLRDHLTVEQAEQLIRSRYFEVLTDSGRRYRVYRDRVHLVERDRATRSYCIHPNEYVPEADAMLAKKLLLDAAEPEFLRIANETVIA